MEKWSVVQWVQGFLGQHGLGWMTPQMQVLTLACLIAVIVKFLVSVFWPAKGGPDADLGRHSKEFFLKVNAMINEAVRRAPPVEAKDPEEGVPFEVYRKDLWRMVDGELSIEEFVDIWRGRKVKKRPTPEELQAMADQTAKEKAEERPVEEELKTRMGRAFLAEWEAHLVNRDPVGFAELFMMNLNEGGEDCRNFHSRFVGFMKTRTWDQVLLAIRPAAKNPTPFLTGNAMWFYAEFRPRVMRKIEEYWNRFLVSKSGHVHQWVRAPRPSYGGVRFECACGEVQEGQVGAEGPRCATGSWLMGPTGPYGPTGIGYPTGLTGPYGPGYPYGVTGPDGLVVPRGPDGDRWMAGVPGVEGYQKWRLGQWVRVTRRTSPAVGQIGRINEVKTNEIRVLVHSEHDDSFIVGVSSGEFEVALPKVGEWWRRLDCKIHQGQAGGPVRIGPDCEWWLHSFRLEDWNCGCIEPVNYGRGM